MNFGPKQMEEWVEMALDGEDVSQHIKRKVVLKNRNPFLKNAIFETSPKLYNAILKTGRINLLNQKVHVSHCSVYSNAWNAGGSATLPNTTNDQTPNTLQRTYAVIVLETIESKIAQWTETEHQLALTANGQILKWINMNQQITASSISCPPVARTLKKIKQTEYEF